MTTETKRDLHADLAICNAASEGFMIHASAVVDENGPYLNVEVYTEEGRPLTSDDATFIVEARTGWPHAIERAINAEARVQELCDNNAYYIAFAVRADDRRWELEEAVSRMGNDLADVEEAIGRLRLAYERGDADEALAIAVSTFLREVSADE